MDKRLNIILIHPVKNAFALQAAKAFLDKNWLAKVYTSYFYKPLLFDRIIKVLVPRIHTKINNELKRRDWNIPLDKMVSIPWSEYTRIFLLKTNLYQRFGFTKGQLSSWMFDNFERRVSKQNWGEIDAVYAYEDCAFNSFKVAKKSNKKCFYDLPIVHYKTTQEILKIELELFPEFNTVLHAVKEPKWKLEKKDEELKLADLVFVPSNFVKNSLLSIGLSQNKIRINVFGAPVEYFVPKPKMDNVFRVIFVGGVGPRKGVHYLIKAWTELNLQNAELLLVGIDLFPKGWLKEKIENQSIRYIPSVPHHLLNDYYALADCFVLPSLVEGLALVQLEAMACGLPVISTINAGAEDIIVEGENGYIVPIRNTEKIKEKISYYFNHPIELSNAKLSARAYAEKFTWKRYREFILEEVGKAMRG